jgi:hypothetical protein
MRDSDTYLAIIDEGREEEAKKAILLIGQERFGPADESITTRLNGVTDVDRLERMIRRAVKATAWQEILDAP